MQQFKIGQTLKSKRNDNLYRVVDVQKRYIITIYLNAEGKEVPAFTYRTILKIAKEIFEEIK